MAFDSISHRQPTAQTPDVKAVFPFISIFAMLVTSYYFISISFETLEINTNRINLTRPYILKLAIFLFATEPYKIIIVALFTALILYVFHSYLNRHRQYNGSVIIALLVIQSAVVLLFSFLLAATITPFTMISGQVH
jgi:hypothetical protein